MANMRPPHVPDEPPAALADDQLRALLKACDGQDRGPPRHVHTISGTLEPGDYAMFCALAGHESLGMRGTMTVSGS